MAIRYEYKRFVHEYTPFTDGPFDVLDWLNELGQDGWVIDDTIVSEIPTGTRTGKGDIIHKIVTQAVGRRQIEE